jgi:predicted Rossmann fold flavoprotein
LVSAAEIFEEQQWAKLPKANLQKLGEQLSRGVFHVNGKGQFKEEFVTCGGVHLDEVNFKTMESRICPGLFFAGEILDVDGVTGGFNFQSAWTTGWLAGTAMSAQIVDVGT